MRGPHWQNRDGGRLGRNKALCGCLSKSLTDTHTQFTCCPCVATGTASKGIQRVEARTVHTASTSVLRRMMGELGTQDKDKEEQMVLSSLWASEQWPIKNFGKWENWVDFEVKIKTSSYCLCIVIDEIWHVKLWQLKTTAPSCHFCHRLLEKKHDCA